MAGKVYSVIAVQRCVAASPPGHAGWSTSPCVRPPACRIPRRRGRADQELLSRFERELPLSPLAVPVAADTTIEALSISPSVRLFVERAQAVPQSVTTGEQFLRGFTPSKDKTIGFADLHFAVPVEDLKDSTKEALERVAPRMMRGDALAPRWLAAIRGTRHSSSCSIASGGRRTRFHRSSMSPGPMGKDRPAPSSARRSRRRGEACTCLPVRISSASTSASASPASRPTHAAHVTARARRTGLANQALEVPAGLTGQRQQARERRAPADAHGHQDAGHR